MTDGADGRRFTAAEWVTLEEHCPGRRELVDGMVVAMAGGSERHDLTAQAFYDRLRSAVKGTGCSVFLQNRRLITFDGDGHYPDVLVRCGPPAHRLHEDDARWVIEVVSPGNFPAQITRKLYAYQQLPSIEVIVFVFHEQRFATLHVRNQAGEWTERRVRDEDVALGTTSVSLKEIWSEVDLEAYTD